MCECSGRNENTAMNKVGTASAFTDGYTTHLYNGCLMSHTRNCLNPDLLCTHSCTGHFAAELGSLRHALVQTLVFLLIHSHRVRRQKMESPVQGWSSRTGSNPTGSQLLLSSGCLSQSRACAHLHVAGFLTHTVTLKTSDQGYPE